MSTNSIKNETSMNKSSSSEMKKELLTSDKETMHFSREIEIIKASVSKIDTVDFENLTFGNIFTDHMLICDFKNGIWGKPQIKPYEPFLLDPSSGVFHYGQAVFEGMKAFKDEHDDVWLFRPDENFKRFNKSALRLAMPEISESIFLGGLYKILNLERAWVKKDKGSSLYIRPFMIATGTGVIASPSTQYRFMIILSPAKSYFSSDVKVIITEHYCRAADGGIGAAKAAGNYSAQFYPTKLANEKGFQQVIWTNSDHTLIEESGTMNVFFKINDTIYTAPTSERILDGITRKSLIDIAKRDGIQLEIQPIHVTTVIEAAKNGSLKEVFGAGTAAVISPISGFSYKEEYYELPKIKNSVALQLKEKLNNIQYKLADDTFGWTVKV